MFEFRGVKGQLGTMDVETATETSSATMAGSCGHEHAGCDRQPKGSCEYNAGHSLPHKCDKCRETF